MKMYHVIRDEEHDAWCLVRAGARRSLRHFKDKDAAVDFGLEIIHAGGGHLTVHSACGAIENVWVHEESCIPV